jgi:hypothetical protein
VERLQTKIVIYISSELLLFLTKKADSGYKISSYVRSLCLKEMKKEQENQGVIGNGK